MLEEEEGEGEVAAQLEAHIPYPTTALRETGAIVARLLLERLQRQIGEQPSEEEQRELARQAHKLSSRLADLGRREDGLTAIQEAVDIRRRLAEQRPDAFLPDLAVSLFVLHDRLAEADQPAAALAAIREALDHLKPMFHRHPPVFAPLMTAILQDYERTAEACGDSPDRPRLEAIREILRQAPEG